MERFNRTLLHIINKPMFINGDGNWVNILNDAVVTYNNNIHSTINMTPVDASNNPDKVKYYVNFTKATPKFKVGDYVRNVDKRNIFSKGYTSNCIQITSKYKNNCNFKITDIDIFTKFAWVIPLKTKSGLSITSGFKIVLGEGPQDRSESRKPEEYLADRGSEFYNKVFKSLLREYETKLYSTYSDLKAVFMEIFNRIFLHIINKPMFINGDGNWVSILNDAVITYNNNIHSTINMTPVGYSSNNPDKVKYYVISTKIKPKNTVGDYLRNADKCNIFSKGYTSNWNRELFKVNEVLKTHPPTYKIEDIMER